MILKKEKTKPVNPPTVSTRPSLRLLLVLFSMQIFRRKIIKQRKNVRTRCETKKFKPMNALSMPSVLVFIFPGVVLFFPKLFFVLFCVNPNDKADCANLAANIVYASTG